jgi:hypothetical protein
MSMLKTLLPMGHVVFALPPFRGTCTNFPWMFPLSSHLELQGDHGSTIFIGLVL